MVRRRRLDELLMLGGMIMGYDLIARSKTSTPKNFHLNISGWNTALRLAGAFGWKPLGTRLRRAAKWDGTYFSNDGQLVSTDDANNLAWGYKKL